MSWLFPSTPKSRRALRFEELVRPHVMPLYQSAYRFTGNREDAEDLVQDVLEKLYPRTPEMERVEDLRPWLLRVLYNRFIDAVRKRNRSPEATVDKSPELTDVSALPDETVHRAELSARIGRALARLDPEDRALVSLHLMQGHVLSELTTVFNVPIGTLKSRLHRAKARLRKMLLDMEPFAATGRVYEHELPQNTPTSQHRLWRQGIS